MSSSGTEDGIVRRLLPGSFKGLSFIDVGTGKGSTGFKIKGLWGYGKGDFSLIGIEVFEPYYEHVKKLGIYDDVILMDASKPWSPSLSCNVGICVHTIEHMSKEEGYRLIENMEGHVRDLIIFVTPHGEADSPPDDNNIYNLHKSAWYEEDFKKLGYSTRTKKLFHTSRVVNLLATVWFLLAYRQRRAQETLIAWKRMV
jgi:hypothetical protein